MINGYRVQALIPARGGSKEIPRKNLVILNGKPLIHWTIKAGLASRYIDSVVVSTDDPEIKEVAIACGAEVPFMRPSELALDQSTSVSVVDHALNQLETKAELLVLLQPTSPLRSQEDIDACIEKCIESGFSSVSCSSVSKPPEWMYWVADDGLMSPVVKDNVHQRQLARQAYVLNGAVYVSFVKEFRERKAFVTERTVASIMPIERSVDIDTMTDLQAAESMFAELNSE